MSNDIHKRNYVKHGLNKPNKHNNENYDNFKIGSIGSNGSLIYKSSKGILIYNENGEEYELNTFLNRQNKWNEYYRNTYKNVDGYTEEILKENVSRMNRIYDNIRNGKLVINHNAINTKKEAKNLMKLLNLVKVPSNSINSDIKKLKNRIKKIEAMNSTFNIISKGIVSTYPLNNNQEKNKYIFLKRTHDAIIDIYPHDMRSFLRNHVKSTNLNKVRNASPIAYFRFENSNSKSHSIYILMYRYILQSYKVSIYEFDMIYNEIIKKATNGNANARKQLSTVQAFVNDRIAEKYRLQRLREKPFLKNMSNIEFKNTFGRKNSHVIPTFNTLEKYMMFIRSKVEKSQNKVNVIIFSYRDFKMQNDGITISNTGHQNALIIIKDKGKYLVTRIEPNGMNAMLYMEVILNNIFDLDPAFKYMGYIEQTCFAPQLFFRDLVFGLQSNSGGGTCMYWTIYLTVLCIMNSNMKEPIINIAEHFDDEFKTFKKYINDHTTESDALRTYDDKDLKEIFYGHKIKVFMKFCEYASTKLNRLNYRNRNN